MDRALRISTGGWLSTSASWMTRGWYEDAGIPITVVLVISPERTLDVPFNDRERGIPFDDRDLEIDFMDRIFEVRPRNS